LKLDKINIYTGQGCACGLFSKRCV